jgi:hypothetical protein
VHTALEFLLYSRLLRFAETVTDIDHTKLKNGENLGRKGKEKKTNERFRIDT